MVVENVTVAERQEEEEFLDKVLDTQVMKIAMNYLKQKGLDDLKNIAYTLCNYSSHIRI